MSKIKVLALGLVCSILTCNNVYAAPSQNSINYKSDTQMTLEELETYYNVAEMAEKYGFNKDDLLKNIYKGIHSEKFSPFTDIESSKEVNSDVKVLRNGTIAYNQQSTMYLATGNPCASGKYPYIGCVAVHRKSSSDKSPILPFGTYIRYVGASVDINGVSYSAFTVEDTGDADFTRTTYWTDVFGGNNTEANRTMARNYGVKSVCIEWD